MPRERREGEGVETAHDRAPAPASPEAPGPGGGGESTVLGDGAAAQGTRKGTPPKTGTRARHKIDPYRSNEIESYVIDLRDNFGLEDRAISERLRSDLGIVIPAKSIREYPRKAREASRYRPFTKTHENPAPDPGGRSYRELRRVHVVHTLVASDVGRNAVGPLCTEIARIKRESNTDEICLGFTGGRTPGFLIRSLAEYMAGLDFPYRGGQDFPRRLILRSLVGVMGPKFYEIDPNFSLIHFAMAAGSIERNNIEVASRGVPVPYVATSDQLQMFRKTDILQPAADVLDELDIIIVSCGHWPRPSDVQHSPETPVQHGSMFDFIDDACPGKKELVQAWADTRRLYEEHDVIGDLGGCLMTAAGPLGREVLPPLRLTSLLEIDDFREFKSRGKSIFALAAPCPGNCRQSKGELIYSILQRGGAPITHLVVDSRSDRDYWTRVERDLPARR